jgi:hypothetical protein
MLATPPKMNSVMLSTGMPARIATMEWPSSCRSNETKNRTLLTIASAHAAPVPRSGSVSGR